MKRIRFVKETAITLYSGLIVHDAMRSLSALTKVMRCCLRSSLTRQQIATAKIAVTDWRRTQVEVYGLIASTINPHTTEHFSQHIGRTGPPPNTATCTAERKNGEFVRRTPITNGVNVDRQHTAAEARWRACEFQLDYELDRLPAVKPSPGPFSVIKCRNADVWRFEELHPDVTVRTLDRAWRLGLGRAGVDVSDSDCHADVVTLYRHFRDSAGKKFDATYDTATGTTIKGDCIQFRFRDSSRDDAWTEGYGRIRHVFETEMDDGATVCLLEVDWLLCEPERGPGNQIRLTPREYALDKRLIPASCLVKRIYLGPDWDEVHAPTWFYLLQCWESAANNTEV
jgi:hypothetical protein